MIRKAIALTLFIAAYAVGYNHGEEDGYRHGRSVGHARGLAQALSALQWAYREKQSPGPDA